MRKYRRANVNGIGETCLWSIHCDICGNPLTDKVRENRKVKEIKGEYLSCGEEELRAIRRGWIVAGKTAICDKCLKSIGDE